MPLYDYTCEDCGKESELLINSNGEATCPDCGSSNLSKLLPLVASPARETSARAESGPPPGPCGSACGCFPHS